MVKSLIAVTLLVMVSIAAWSVLAEDAPVKDKDEEKQSTSVWMRKKADYSRAILTGLTTDDMDLVHKSATAMRRMSTLEKWARRGPDTKEYRAQLNYFNAATDQLIKQAEAENTDGAALAYVQMTLSCINCHKHLRDNE